MPKTKSGDTTAWLPFYHLIYSLYLILGQGLLALTSYACQCTLWLKATYSSPFLRREATAAESAASPVPKRITVTGSGTGTGPEGGGVAVGGTGVGVSGANVTIVVGVSVGETGVSVGETGVLVGVAVAVSVGATPVFVAVGDGGSVGVSVISAGASCAETALVGPKPGRANMTTKNKLVTTTTNRLIAVLFIARFLPGDDRYR